MSIKKELYAINRGKTLADNIDKAWTIYCDAVHHPEDDRKIAQAFLIYAFNLKSIEHLNTQLLALMAKRNLYKTANPDYIPGLSPKHLNLEPEKLNLTKTVTSGHSPDATVQTLFDHKELLDVRTQDKQQDQLNKTRFLSRQQRANKRIHLFQGKFFQKGELFSTKDYESHEKQGFAAFTLNANGELSVFQHVGMMNHIGHSSMNAGSPVVFAGELIISDGIFKGITTYSGHYNPSLFNVYRVLDYLSEKGVSLAHAKVYTFKDPARVGLRFNSTHSPTFLMPDFYTTSAIDVYKTIKNDLHYSLLQIQRDAAAYQAFSFKNIVYAIKDWVLSSTLTKDRQLIANSAASSAADLLSQLPDNDAESVPKLDALIGKLEELRESNDNLSEANRKNKDSGRLHKKIESFIQQAKAIQLITSPATLEDEQRMKLVY